MRILVVNKFWYRRAGLERVMFDEIAALEAAGHEVAHLSTTHPANVPSPWSSYFIPYLEIGPHSRLGIGQQAVAAARMFYNVAAARRLARLLRDFRPDVLHAHGIHRHISPSILVVARHFGVPVVQSVHDLNLVCPSGDLLAGGEHLCAPRRCGRFDYLPAVRNRCVQDSVVKSCLAGTELFWRRWVLRYGRLVDVFVCPSRFMATMLRSAGWSRPLVRVVPNAVPLPPLQPLGDSFLYIGRLSREKGLPVLLSAAGSADVPVVVAGDGPLATELRDDTPSHVTLLGHVSGEDVDGLIAGSRVVVVPSIGYENAPMSILEAMAAGRAVVASRIGGIPEQMRDGVEGLLVPPGDVSALSNALQRLDDDESLAGQIGQAARRRVASEFTPDKHLVGLLSAYAVARQMTRLAAVP